MKQAAAGLNGAGLATVGPDGVVARSSVGAGFFIARVIFDTGMLEGGAFDGFVRVLYKSQGL